MADISQELARILSAVYGEEVRGSIHDAIEKINDVSEVVLSTGTAVTSSSSSSEGYYVDSLYLNTDEMELWKCMGTNSWQSQGFFKGDKGDTGDDGVGITSITKTSTSGLVDTYTISYTDSTTSTFTVTNGADGEDGKGIVSITKTSTAGLVDTYTILYTDNTTTTFEVHNGRVGNKWYTGHIIEGKSVNPTVFSSSGISYAYEGDMYLNTTEGAVYHCSREGDPLVATWVYDFTIQGAGSGATVMSDLEDVDINTILDGQVLQYDSENSDWKNRTIIDNIVENSTKAAQSGAVYTALAGKQDTLTEGTGIDITSNVVSIDADSTPTSESNKPVTSGGLYTKFGDYYTKTEMDAIDGVINEIQRTYGVHNLTPFDPRYAETNNIIVDRWLGNGTVRYNTPENPVSEDTIMGINDVSNSATSQYTHNILEAGSYKLVVYTNSAMSANKCVKVYDTSTETVLAEANSGTDAVIPFTLSADTNVLVAACFASGQTLTDFEVQAFIILGSDTDTTYSPFTMSNALLTSGQYYERIADCNTVYCGQPIIKYYYTSTSPAHAPGVTSAWQIIETNASSTSAIQIAIALTGTYRYIYLRRKVNGEWPTTPTSGDTPYGWHEVWDSMVHNKLYAHIIPIQNTSTTAVKTIQAALYEVAQNFKALVNSFLAGYTIEIHYITFEDKTNRPLHGALRSTGSGSSQNPTEMNVAFGATIWSSYRGYQEFAYYMNSTELSKNYATVLSISIPTTATSTSEDPTIKGLIRDGAEFLPKKTSATIPSKNCTIYYKINKLQSTDPSEVN